LEALAELERAYELESEPFEKHWHLVYLGQAAVAARIPERAVEAAEQVLREARTHKGKWHYGNSIHWAHIVLGHVALLRGDTATAVAELTSAGRTDGSPQLDSFGPDLRLAAKLLEVGQRAEVKAYLVDCQRFWASGRRRLARWIEQLNAGETPALLAG
jgi:hypothetical protein